MKPLIAYYSRRGQNYVGGEIVDLPVGNTEVAAGILQRLTDGEMYRIDTVKAYPADYHATTEIAKREIRQNARPELVRPCANMADYNVIIVGYPNWWGTMPMAVWTFLETHELSGKTILPLCTHEGSGLGHSCKDIQKLCPGATVSKGLAIQGGHVHRAEAEIAAWLQGLKIIKP